MLETLLIIILSQIAIIAGLFSLFIILGIVYSIISIPITLAKQVMKCQKQEDQKNIQK